MKNLTVVLLSLLFTNSYASSLDKVVYGVDNRLNYSQAPKKIQKLADATAGMVTSGKLSLGESTYLFSGTRFGGSFVGNYWDNGPICEDEKFADEYKLPICSGFLVGKDTLVTAGHCVYDENDCKKKTWIFGYTKDVAAKGEVPSKNVYECKELVSKGEWGEDFAVIKLDRKVKGRTPLKMAKNRVKVNDKVFVIGHPSGLPTKIAAGAKVVSSKVNVFKTNLDTFGGNSGSAVFLEKTNKVVGILVRGATDYKRDQDAGCFRTNKCEAITSGIGCGGEGVTHLDIVKFK